jgi:cyclohexa-1,5-dienecarbonyl-CoA hydratase
MSPATGSLRVERLEEGQVWRAVIDAPKANLVDRAMGKALRDLCAEAAAAPALKAVILEGAGAHFSFGASVEEHLPGAVDAMITEFHATFRAMLDAPVVWLAAVRGRCLGGGLEVAAFCHRVFAAEDAVLGQPEIVLGVFAPMASTYLPDRVGRPAAEELCLSGRSVPAAEALAMGLVDVVAPDPDAAALAWAKTHLLPRSASSLRLAVRALRAGWRRRFEADLAEAERLYLVDLMKTGDAVEGLEAFLAKRPPAWRNA